MRIILVSISESITYCNSIKKAKAKFWYDFICFTFLHFCPDIVALIVGRIKTQDLRSRITKYGGKVARKYSSDVNLIITNEVHKNFPVLMEARKDGVKIVSEETVLERLRAINETTDPVKTSENTSTTTESDENFDEFVVVFEEPPEFEEKKSKTQSVKSPKSNKKSKPLINEENTIEYYFPKAKRKRTPSQDDKDVSVQKEEVSIQKSVSKKIENETSRPSQKSTPKTVSKRIQPVGEVTPIAPKPIAPRPIAPKEITKESPVQKSIELSPKKVSRPTQKSPAPKSTPKSKRNDTISSPSKENSIQKTTPKSVSKSTIQPIEESVPKPSKETTKPAQQTPKPKLIQKPIQLKPKQKPQQPIQKPIQIDSEPSVWDEKSKEVFNKFKTLKPQETSTLKIPDLEQRIKDVTTFFNRKRYYDREQEETPNERRLIIESLSSNKFYLNDLFIFVGIAQWAGVDIYSVQDYLTVLQISFENFTNTGSRKAKTVAMYGPLFGNLAEMYRKKRCYEYDRFLFFLKV